MELTRRQFIGKTTAAVIVGGMMATGKVFGANNRIRVCTIGFNGQGRGHINDILGLKDEAEYTALCDVDSEVLARGAEMVQAKQGKAPKLYRDIREALQDKEIDAVTIATPNHWHTLAAIWAAQAGKDVYVEKPLSHSIYEGRQLTAAAGKYQRIVQHGTQSRSSATLRRDIKLIHDGFIGEIVESRGYVYKNGNRGPIGHGKPGPVPANLDWPLWQGPARDHEFMINIDRKKPGLYVHYDWHYFWEYGNGEIGNQGVHQMDIACWGHNRGLPVNVYSAGGRFGLNDDGQTPNTQATTFTYADGTILTFQVRNLGSYEEFDGSNCGNSFFGTKGFYVVGRGFFSYQEGKKDGKPSDRAAIPVPDTAPALDKGNKWDRFFKAIRSRNPADMPVSTLDAHYSCVHCQLGNIAFRLGRSLEFEPKAERFKDREANKYVKREYRKGFEVPQLA
ncbi:MAG: Gfo/Idh/MocA family oxidoreductase [Verrucomicrobiota bacterium]|nr:Gfo/Idh/MocA family oxidoreductase [Limisphaerales bacterium]